MTALLAILAALTVSWDRNPEPEVAGYRLAYGTASGLRTHIIEAGTATSVQVPDPPKGVTWFITVRAYVALGTAGTLEGEPSAEVHWPGHIFEVPTPDGAWRPQTSDDLRTWQDYTGSHETRRIAPLLPFVVRRLSLPFDRPRRFVRWVK